MAYTYNAHNWVNETTPAINDEHLNEMEQGIKTAIDALNNDVYLKSQGGEGLFPPEYKKMLDELDQAPAAGHDNVLISSAGVYNSFNGLETRVDNKLTEVDEKVTAAEDKVASMASAFGGEIKPFAPVAFSGSYKDLTDVPTPGGDVPGDLAKVAYSGDFYDLINISNVELNTNKTFSITEESTNGEYPSAKAVYDKISGFEEISNKTTEITEDSTDDEYPSAKAVYGLLGDIEKALAKL